MLMGLLLALQVFGHKTSFFSNKKNFDLMIALDKKLRNEQCYYFLSKVPHKITSCNPLNGLVIDTFHSKPQMSMVVPKENKRIFPDFLT